MRGVTRAVGALDRDKECEEGSYPNPMEVLQGYLLTEKIVPSSEYSIFTSCNVKEIEKALSLRSKFLSFVFQIFADECVFTYIFSF